MENVLELMPLSEIGPVSTANFPISRNTLTPFPGPLHKHPVRAPLITLAPYPNPFQSPLTAPANSGTLPAPAVSTVVQ